MTSETAGTPGIDLVMERRIFRKLMVRLFPILIIGIFVAYMDRANLGVVKAPVSKDLALNGAAFGLAAGSVATVTPWLIGRSARQKQWPW
ncbi:sugar phosphate permease [Mycolicibacterium sp. BK556]|uniref:hypothetical protein n=1 Tax=unclassified Mycolicibacterium TaxID=2636767 RepID=UPI00161B1D1F|nr:MULTISPECIES: hypothetical protein [unclassified Mycolicibacterium]MBB3607073.1 sugar phosphate permease [Mycolicibacterium sp. BK556]MBB3636817.1 sugar phosphate permease [Mycolicibacterium sp. BK607]